MTEPLVVRMENAEKVYQLGTVSVHALRGVNFTASKGEFVVIMGASGSGKTTMLNLIGALDKPTSGKIYIGGKDLTTLREKDLTQIRRHKVGFVFQFYNLIPVLTALENVELPMLVAGVKKKEREHRARELLALVGLAQRADHRPDELSGGEQQRVAIARALTNRPSIILADEPTGDLDSKSGAEVLRVLRDLSQQEGVTVIAVTHDPIVSDLADRILRIHDGEIIADKKMTKQGDKKKPSPRVLTHTISDAKTVLAEPVESKVRFNRLFSNAGLLLMALGSVLMAFISWLTWYDLTVWGKNITLVFFGSRTGEAISLAIGMKVIYYFLISLTLLTFGIIAVLRKHRKLPRIMISS